MTGFIRLDVELAHEIGLDAAVLYERIRWRCQRLPDGWVATYAELSTQTSLSRRRVMQAATKLRDLGLIESVVSGLSARTLRWVAKSQNEMTKVPKRDLPSMQLERQTQDNPLDADASKPLEDAMDEQSAASVTPIDGGLFALEAVPHERTPQESANLCRQAWIQAFTAAHGRPDPTVKLRALGQIKAATKGRVEPEDWSHLWRACAAAGTAGRWTLDLGPTTATANTPRWNENTALKMLRGGQQPELGPSPMDRLLGGSA